MKELPKRKHIRLRNYDYSQNGCYFITICVKDKRQLLGHYKSKEEFVGAGLRACPRDLIVLTPLGREVEKAIDYIHTHYDDFDIENAIVMPNHVHLLITIDNIEARYTGRHGDLPLQDVIRNFKSYTTKKYWELTGEKDDTLWQSRYIDRIIRNQSDFEHHWNYIEYNALKEYGTKEENI